MLAISQIPQPLWGACPGAAGWGSGWRHVREEPGSGEYIMGKMLKGENKRKTLLVANAERERLLRKALLDATRKSK